MKVPANSIFMNTQKQKTWITRSSETIYDNAWISVSHHNVTAPTGKGGIYGTVHFKNTAVGIVPIDDNGFTWLVGQYRYPLEQYSWEIPEGGSPAGEDVLLTAQRELREETGITASRWTPLLELHTSNSVTDEYGVAFVAQGLELGTHEFDETEVLQVQRLPLESAIEMALDGRITDGLAMVSLMKVRLWLDQGKLAI